MASVGDILRITSCGNLFDQQVCNVFYYLVAVWTGNLDFSDVAATFKNDILDELALIVSDQMSWGEVKVENLDDPAEQHVAPITLVGSQTGPGLPSYVAASMKLVRTTAATRHGSKRFAGVTEAQVAENELTSVAAYATLETNVASELDSGSDFTLDPVIVGRNTDGSLNLAVINPISAADTSSIISTQNSRKVGHGS